MAFELLEPAHPLCRLTASPDSHAVYRILDTGEISRRHRAHVTLRAPSEAVATLVREMRTQQPQAIMETTPATGGETTLIIETPLDAPSPGLAGLPLVLAQRNIPAVVDPIVARNGRLRVRLLIARQLDPQEVLRALQELPRACGMSDLRVLRISAIPPAAHVEHARRTLPAEQETLLGIAASMGYYATPKLVTLEQISRVVGLSISPVHKRLKAAEEIIVSQHVAPAAVSAPRRARNALWRVEPTTPWEVVLRVRGESGLAGFLAQTPGARAALHVLAHDAAREQSSLLVLLAPEEAQTKLFASLEDRPDVAHVEVVERAATHATCRLRTRERGAYALGWWSDVWGHDAVLRSIAYDGADMHIRALLCRPLTQDRLEQRLAACAHAAGWTDWGVVSLRRLGGGSPPEALPEPLTQRQLEVLRVAHALGYYRTPRACTLEQVAGTLGVSANAVHKNLVLAEGKLIAAYLAGGL